ncbi:MAG: GNAT family N-acetyltransferase [Chloroflexota bacterium]
MELANIMVNNSEENGRIRQATRSDAKEIMKLLQSAPYRHMHVDWYVPGDWIGSAGFLLKIKPPVKSSRSQFAKFLGESEKVQSLFAVTADPRPAAWVRVVSLGDKKTAVSDLAELITAVKKPLKEEGNNVIAWLAIEEWPNQWLPELGFKCVNHIETYAKEDTEIPDRSINPDIDIRPVLDKDIVKLAQLEAKAFNALWRHSAQGLQLAKNQSFSFDVALLHDEIVGFQLSTPNDYGVHLVRLTVDPDLQGKGVGTALMTHALRGYYRRDRYRITLNTQSDNQTSQTLYTKFGFKPSGQKFPVWISKI